MFGVPNPVEIPGVSAGQRFLVVADGIKGDRGIARDYCDHCLLATRAPRGQCRSDGGAAIRMKPPNTKLQIRNPYVGLGFGVWDFFGAWCLGFGIWDLGQRLITDNES